MTQPVQRLPWVRQFGESQKAFAAWEVYRALGADRSLQKVRLQLPKCLSVLKRWSKRWAWVARAAEWDAHEMAQRRAAELRILEDDTGRWAERLKFLRNEEWEASQQLLERVKAMLKFPLSRQVARQSLYTLEEMQAALNAQRRLPQDTTEVVPFKWGFANAVGALDLASRLMRLAAGAPTSATALVGPGGGPVQIESQLSGGMTLDMEHLRKRGRELLFERLCAERGIRPDGGGGANG